MYTAYDLKIDRTFFDDIENYQKIGEMQLRQNTGRHKKQINELVRQKTINGSDIQGVCFPEVNAQVFISHSHKDKDLANALAGWLYNKFRLNAFIDSNVWEYSNDLLARINDIYSNKQFSEKYGYFYDLKACNLASQHVNIMLLTALQNMIDKTECIIFLNTDNSIQVFDDKTKEMNRTYSPWIYSEIFNTRIIRKKPLYYYREYHGSEIRATFESVEYIGALQVGYNVSLNHLINLDCDKLIEWFRKYNDNESEYRKYPLDALYSLTNPKDLENAKIISTYVTEDQREELRIIQSAIDGNPKAQKTLSESFFKIYCERSQF